MKVRENFWKQEMMQALNAQLAWNMEKNESSNIGSGGSGILWPVVLSLIVTIFPKEEKEKYQEQEQEQELDSKYLTFFLQHAIQQSLASASTLALAQYYIASLDSKQVVEKVIPAMALKLKANPETSMETVHEIVKYIDPCKVRALTDPKHDAGTENANGNGNVVEQNMIPTVMKQLIHSKESMRYLAGSLLGLLGRFEDTCRIVLGELGGLLLGKLGNGKLGTMVKLTTAEHRLGVYRALEMIASDIILSKDSSVSSRLLSLGLSCVEINDICKAIVTPMVKETAGKAKQVGMVALLKWMSCYQEGECLSSSGNEDHGGYWLAMNFLSKAILDMKQGGGSNVASAMGGEFRFRFENLFAVCDYDVAQVMVGHLWEYAKRQGTEGKMCAGLSYVVDACAKKHGNSNIVAQVDGLIAIHMILIFTTIEMENQGKDLNASSIVTTLLPPSVVKILQSGAELLVDGRTALQSKDSSISFLYSRAMLDAYTTDPVVSELLYRSIALYTKVVRKSPKDGGNRMKVEQKGIVRMEENNWSAAANAIAYCVTQELEEQGKSDSVGENIVASIESITVHTLATDRASDAIVAAIFSCVDDISKQKIEHEQEPFCGINSLAVRRTVHYLARTVTNAKQFTQVMILSYCGLNFETANNIEESCDDYEDNLNSVIDCGIAAGFTEAQVADSFIHLISGAKDDEQSRFILSKALHSSALSMLVTLGKIGSAYDQELIEPDTEDLTPCSFAWKLCVKELAVKLADVFNLAVSKSENLKEIDLALYNSPDGQLFTFSKESDENSKSKMTKSRMTEEEEWERQVKQELAEKRKKTDGVPSLSNEDKSKIEKQTVERNQIRYILDWALSGTLSFIRALCQSDIEVGNAILPVVTSAVTSAAVSTSMALNLGQMKKECFSTLCTLAECVFEIDEEYAEAVARCLVSCPKRDGESCKELRVVPFPSNCEYAEITVSAMEDYGDIMSGNSFVFLFPIIRAALTGPRTTQGCESALRILKWHTALIGKDSTIATIRKDMAASVLELLSHDRSKSFKDPTPTETLLGVYPSDEKPLASVLAPLLNESGALGNNNCRLASMTVFAAILKSYPSLVKTNPVVENRVLVNCFAVDEPIKSEAIRAWKIAQGAKDDYSPLPAPSKIFAVAMLPLLSHEDDDISNAAAAAFAFGIEKHPDSADKSLNRLFNAYIESYPTVSDQCDSNVVPVPQVPAVESHSVVTKKPKALKLDIGSVKKPAVKKKKASSAMAALTKTAATKKKTKTTSAIASFAPKKERVIDQESLMSQFIPTATESQKKVEKDSTEKIAVRSGVLRVISDLTGPSSKTELDSALLQILVCFLITFGLADINDMVRSAASIALRDTVASDSFKSTIDFILPLLENALQDGKSTKACLRDLPVDKVLDDISATDHRKEGVVVALGSAAIHLRDVEDEEKIRTTFNMLINALSTPSESVQASVAICLSKLMKKGDMKSKTEELLECQLQECLHGKTLATRRGAAYGISAIVKGSGIATLKKFSVVKQLEEACTTGSASTKEGALFAIELLSDRLGLLFEPYVIVLLPALLKSFSDTSDHVRLAARNSVGLIMSKLSGHGVKLLVPAVLAGLEQEDWRTKQASIHMLGTMSHCAPKQLAR
jgi:HEAT repeat.